MGAVFSKKLTIKDKLLNLENEIIKKEYELNTLKNTHYYSLLIVGSLLIPFISYFSYLLEVSIIIVIILVFFIIGGLFYILRIIKSKRIEYKERNLEVLKKERKSLIEQCKADLNFSMTKSLIEKYEEEESRSTFFNQLKKKKKNTFENVADFVLGNDPSNLNALICKNCGVHNGLIDPKNDDFKYFQCYSCSYKNKRKLEQQQQQF